MKADGRETCVVSGGGGGSRCWHPVTSAITVGVLTRSQTA